MDELDKLRIFGLPKKTNIPIHELVKLVETREKTIYESEKDIDYVKSESVDYDVVITIPSFERYKKIRRLLSQFYGQSTQYSFKIILLNDGSIDTSYDNIIKEFPDIVYLKNNEPNAKILHWYSYNQLWENIKNIRCHAIIQMDDDFILCDNFLNTIIDIYFREKKKDNKMKAIAPHLWSFKKISQSETWWDSKNVMDGISLIDIEVIKYMNYTIKPVDVNQVKKPGVPARVWSQICNEINKMGGWIYRTDNSLVYHDGNDESKLHKDFRINEKNQIYTQKYIGTL